MLASLTQLNHGHSVIYTRDVSSLLISKILIFLLALLWDRGDTLDMQIHTMKLNIKAISALNPGQTPVDASDCPVSALTKEAQFQLPEHFSELFGDVWRVTYGAMLVGYSWTIH